MGDISWTVAVSHNFTLDEYCSEENRIVPAYVFRYWLDNRLITICQHIRNHFGRVMTITSGYRTPEYNKKINGSKGSLHTLARAVDFVVEGVSPEEIQDWIIKNREHDQILLKIKGLGRGKTFSHVDCRNASDLVIWDYGK